MRLLSYMALALGVQAACGDIVDSGSRDAGAEDAASATDASSDPCQADSVPIELFRDCFVDAFCSSYDCGVESGPGGVLPLCVDPGVTIPFVDRPLGLVAAGTVTYDGQAAATCIRSLRNACRVGLGATAAALRSDSLCTGAFRGVLTTGQPCFLDEECGASGFCGGQDSGCVDAMQCCPGTCTVSSRPLFASCDPPVEPCDPGLFCVENPSTGSASCQLGRFGAPCSDQSECAIDHYCLGADTDMLGTCEPDKPENAACQADSECAAPTRCLGDDDTMVGSAVCGDVSLEGDVCDADPGDGDIFAAPDCLGELYCAGTAGGTVSGACTPLPGAGDSCAESNECAAGAYCDAGSCLERVAAGGSCSSSGVCQDGLVCLPNGTCGAPLAGGQPCEDNGNCRSSTCVAGACEDLATCR